MTATATTPTPRAASVPPARRMKLDAIVKGKQEEPRRVLLYGPEGIGKSTFGANAPSPIFLTPEAGTSQLDIVRFPQPEGWTDILDAVRTLTEEAHDYKTLVLDTLDAAEPMLWAHMVKRDSSPGKEIRDVEDYGYGKGYQKALDEWRVLLAALERLRAAKKMNVILLAHSWIKSFKNPEGEDFDRYELKLNTKAGGLLKEWCDAVLFASYETYAHKDEKTKRVKGVSTGARIIHTERAAAFDAKNRFALPLTLALSWADFDAAARAGQVAAPETLREAIVAGAKTLGGDLEKKITETMTAAGDDAARLAQILNRVNAKLAEKAEGN